MKKRLPTINSHYPHVETLRRNQLGCSSLQRTSRSFCLSPDSQSPIMISCGHYTPSTTHTSENKRILKRICGRGTN